MLVLPHYGRHAKISREKGKWNGQNTKFVFIKKQCFNTVGFFFSRRLLNVSERRLTQSINVKNKIRETITFSVRFSALVEFSANRRGIRSQFISLMQPTAISSLCCVCTSAVTWQKIGCSIIRSQQQKKKPLGFFHSPKYRSAN